MSLAARGIHDGEIDLGFGGALRSAATIVANDPIFGWITYGGTQKERAGELAIVPRDGLRQRFDAIPNNQERLKLELNRDGFAANKEITLDKNLHKIKFTLENRTGDAHDATLPRFVLPASKTFHVQIDSSPNCPDFHRMISIIRNKPSSTSNPKRSQLN